ncbi:hypothetical protein K491DRAFT_467037 [Lophiostoma macrostomum CBS 122681]|uniref:Uncharacterized protein n=1 Tax=Lophiostoma macrostomum CBS 122681 TaxID=1314788 RepID=A0A6A6T450_9PLEO|nr:hypothetical protein K491DRAFT_467037 [Lophiostoma macrostomum CBS 122681]
MPPYITYSRRNMSVKPDISDMATEVGSLGSSSDDDTPDILNSFSNMRRTPSVETPITNKVAEVSTDYNSTKPTKASTRIPKLSRYSNPFSDMLRDVGSDNDAPISRKRSSSTPNLAPVKTYSTHISDMTTEVSSLSSPHDDSDALDYMKPSPRMRSMASSKEHSTPKRTLAEGYDVDFPSDHSSKRRRKEVPPTLSSPGRSRICEQDSYTLIAQEGNQSIPRTTSASPDQGVASHMHTWERVKASNSLGRKTSTTLSKNDEVVKVRSLGVHPSTSTFVDGSRKEDVKSYMQPWARLRTSASPAGKPALPNQHNLIRAIRNESSHAKEPLRVSHPTSNLIGNTPKEEDKSQMQAWGQLKYSGSLLSTKIAVDKNDLIAEVGIEPRDTQAPTLGHALPPVGSGGRPRRRHAGPISFAGEDEENENLDTPPTGELPELRPDKVRIKSHTKTSGKVNIHGSQEDFMRTYGRNVHTKQNMDARGSSRYGQPGTLHSKLKHVAIYKKSAKPPMWANASAMKKEQPSRHFCRGSGNPPSRGRALPKPQKLGPMFSQPSMLKTVSRKAKTVKKPYKPKSNEVFMQAVPRTDILGKPIVAGSRQSDL